MAPRESMPHLAELLYEVLSRGHHACFRATGDSMDPTIRDGELVEVAPMGDDEAPALREIVLVDSPRGLTAHRVVDLREGGRIVTRGDNATSIDQAIERGRIVGRIVARQRAGRMRSLTGQLKVALHLVRARVTRFRRAMSRSATRDCPEPTGAG